MREEGRRREEGGGKEEEGGGGGGRRRRKEQVKSRTFTRGWGKKRGKYLWLWLLTVLSHPHKDSPHTDSSLVPR